MRKRVASFLTIVILCASIAYSQDSVTIGFIYILSGRAAYIGQVAQQGASLAIDQVNNSGGINGKKLVGIFEDSEGKPQKAADLAKRLIQKDRVDVIMGITSSGEAEAVAPIAAEFKTPLLVTTANASSITGEMCNKFNFRITCTSKQHVKSPALIAAQTKARRWTTVGPDYLLGHETWDLFQQYLSKIGNDVSFLPKSDVAFAPMSTSDWTPHIQKVMKSDADGIVISLWGGNAVDFFKQAGQAGFFDGKRTFLLTMGGTVDFFMALGSQMPVGIWVGPAYWFQGNYGSENEAFVKSYEERFNFPPSHMAATAYLAIMAYSEALKRSGNASPDFLVKTLEGLEFDSPLGKTTIRREDHQALFDLVWGQTSEKMYKLKKGQVLRSLHPIIDFSPDQVLPPPTETGCVMK